VPYIRLPGEINLSIAAFENGGYSHAALSLPASNGTTQTLKPEPLVFYAAALADSADPNTAQKFVDYLAGGDGQRMLRENGYSPPAGECLP